MRTIAAGIMLTLALSPAHAGGASVEFLTDGGDGGYTPADINDAGVVVGSFLGNEPFIRLPGQSPSMLPTFETDSGEHIGDAEALNSSGIAVGYSLVDEGSPRATMWDATGGIRRIGPDIPGARAVDITASGLVLGSVSGVTAGLFLWSEQGGTQSIELLPDASRPSDFTVSGSVINDDGVVAATFYSEEFGLDNPSRAFVRTSEGSVSEATLPDGYEPISIDLMTGATAIVTSRAIGTDAGEFIQRARSFLWTPESAATELPLFAGLPATVAAHNDTQMIMTTRSDVSLESRRDFLFDPFSGETVELTSLIRSLTGFERYELTDFNNRGQLLGVAFEDGASPAIGFVLTIPSPATALPFVLLGALRRRRALKNAPKGAFADGECLTAPGPSPRTPRSGGRPPAWSVWRAGRG